MLGQGLAGKVSDRPIPAPAPIYFDSLVASHGRELERERSLILGCRSAEQLRHDLDDPVVAVGGREAIRRYVVDRLGGGAGW